ncbi:MAG: hypothetical protein JXR49_05730 [Acidobacteria bacterium]|nr:hypothetical protein [Acidobacteriota bacterium]
MNKLHRYSIVLILFIAFETVSADDQISQVFGGYEPLYTISDLNKGEFLDEYCALDFSPLWMYPNIKEYRGFIGDNYQRMRIKIVSVSKDIKKPTQYYVDGKSAVDGKICIFQGNFNITSIRKFETMHWGVDYLYKNQGIKSQGVVVGTYKLIQNKCGSRSGYFEGTLSALWYSDKSNKLHYDDIESGADPFRNNQFIGTWKGYDENEVKVSNWGDYRIPYSGDLDVGAGEFYPNKKYAKYGWQSLIDLYESYSYTGENFDWNQ